MKFFKRCLSRVFFRGKKTTRRWIRSFAFSVHNKKILEIGSGRSDYYSMKSEFCSCNEFIQSDLNGGVDRIFLDVTKLEKWSCYDIIVCCSVLEHVFDFEKAIKNMFFAVKDGGVVLVVVPFLRPLHDIPNDFFRFTEFGLKKLFSKFSSVVIKKHGLTEEVVFSYFVIAKK